MTLLSNWALRWAIPNDALRDLRARLGELDTLPVRPDVSPLSEAAVQANVRLEASRLGIGLWRNNVGAYQDPETGGWVRYGLANDSKALNGVVKSGDLIGVKPVLITQAEVGKLIGQFVSYEVKHSQWRYTGTPREVAQSNWAKRVVTLGGDARFVNGPGQITSS